MTLFRHINSLVMNNQFLESEANMTLSKYTFERTELRTLQNMCEGDNEKFLNLLADMIGERDEQIHHLKQQIADDSWDINPDNMGGAFTQDEIDDAVMALKEHLGVK